MGKEREFMPHGAEILDQIVLDRWIPEVFHRFQCVWLDLVLELSARETAQALGLNVTTVRRIRAEFRRDGAKAILGGGNRGGRRYQYMSFAEESAFLREHADLLDRMGAQGVKAFQEAFEARVGKAVHKTTIYRMLDRHGARKSAVMATGSGSDARFGGKRVGAPQGVKAPSRG
jgi:hypothetical protein